MPKLTASDVRSFIPSKDFALSRRFYAALGWEVHELGPDLAVVSVSETHHFYLQDYYTKDFAENSMLHVTVHDAAAWHAHVAGLLRDDAFPGAAVRPPARQDYGATVVFVHDPCGVLLHLCEWDR